MAQISGLQSSECEHRFAEYEYEYEYETVI
jgi:hypothetical protein